MMADARPPWLPKMRQFTVQTVHAVQRLQAADPKQLDFARKGLPKPAERGFRRFRVVMRPVNTHEFWPAEPQAR
jgi:hypothetical protein